VVSVVQEHASFEEGLRRWGTNWRMIQKMVPTRSLVQIRTHAQKYFLKHQMPVRGTGERLGAGAFRALRACSLLLCCGCPLPD